MKKLLFLILALFPIASFADNITYENPRVGDIYSAIPANKKVDINGSYPIYYGFNTGSLFSANISPVNMNNYCLYRNNGSGTGTYISKTTTGATTATRGYFDSSGYLTYGINNPGYVTSITCFYPDPPSCATVEPACSGISCTLSYNPTQSNQTWLKNANSCGFSCTNGYVGPTCSTLPVNISGYFDPLTLDYTTYTWNMTLHLSTGAMVENVEDIQVWDWFDTTAIVGITSDPYDPKIVFSVKKADDNSISPCSSFSYTIPAGKLVGNDGFSTNSAPITGSFTLIGCSMPVSITGTLSSGFDYQSGSFLSGAMIGDFIPWSVKDNSGNTFLSQEGLFLVLRNSILFILLVLTMILLIKKSFSFFSGKWNVKKHF